MQHNIFHHGHLCGAVPCFEPIQPFRKFQILKKSQMAWLIFIFELSGQKARQFLRAVSWHISLHEETHDLQLPNSLHEVEVGDTRKNLF